MTSTQSTINKLKMILAGVLALAALCLVAIVAPGLSNASTGGSSTSQWYCEPPWYTLCYSARTNTYRCFEYAYCGGSSTSAQQHDGTKP